MRLCWGQQSSAACHCELPGAAVSRLACILKRWPLHRPPLLVLPSSRQGCESRIGGKPLDWFKHGPNTTEATNTSSVLLRGQDMIIYTGSAIRSNSRAAQDRHQMCSRAVKRKLERMPCSAPSVSNTTQGLVTKSWTRKT